MNTMYKTDFGIGEINTNINANKLRREHIDVENENYIHLFVNIKLIFF